MALTEHADRPGCTEGRKGRSLSEFCNSLGAWDFGPLTVVLIGASLLVFVLSRFGRRTIDNVPWLFITHLRRDGFDVVYRRGLIELRRGQLWRLITPVFIHFDFLHLFFNLFWLHNLGGMVETRLGALRLAALVLVIGSLSNLAEFAWTGPYFGGMSGVVYGLIGYVWMKSKFDPASGLVLHPWTVAMAAIWFLLCLAEVVPAANTAHAVGLVVGIVWGHLSGRRRG